MIGKSLQRLDSPPRRPRLLTVLLIGLTVTMLDAGLPETARAQGAAAAAAEQPEARGGAQSDAYLTTVAYVSQFYPLWFTYNQSRFASHGRLAGPKNVTPLYQIVVAINVDTLYASTFLDLGSQAQVLTIPSTTATYSVLTLDAYGDILTTNITAGQAGTYVLTGPGFKGTLPDGVTAVPLSVNFAILIFRADKFSSSGEDETAAANAFRSAIEMQPLCAYTNTRCPHGTSSGGTTLILPEVPAFSIPYKTIADTLVAKQPIKFLEQLQTAVASSNTPPMTPAVKALSDHFNRLFGNGTGTTRQWDFAAGAQAAHALILDRYLGNTGETNWIHFTNIGNWGDDVVERSSITEFIQYGNGIATAAYYQAFEDGAGAPLNGRNQSYVLTFPAGDIPDAKRFWSVTAYTPQAIELVANTAGTYDVASYTPGLVTNPDGSISIYLATELPSGVPAANWLPIPSRNFNLMLRVYGPQGSVANDTYVPPAIQEYP